jgi:hypothetical protein
MHVTAFINNRNIFTWLQAVIQDLERMNFNQIVVVDNDSTYPPLLEYYKSLPHEVYCVGHNGGIRSPWQFGPINKWREQHGEEEDAYYVVTDPDLDLSRVPDDVVKVMVGLMRQDDRKDKIGLSLEIEDLSSDAIVDTEHVYRHESRFWRNEARMPEGFPCKVYHAPVDTTFAIYANQTSPRPHGKRLGPPYIARHLPWYVN